ncbi:hypothetical protein U27_02357 [Candidatus Vecturithrix granuli]|uniref:Uncharacterized protein n=1 Tax=Vecturithrix granuli TaxID=1499967 RepID=A0A0S6WBI0_VECG1|nr:hypothetical protein U27_02357 [Candidatus Vecturithrix granuli]
MTSFRAHTLQTWPSEFTDLGKNGFAIEGFFENERQEHKEEKREIRGFPFFLPVEQWEDPSTAYASS